MLNAIPLITAESVTVLDVHGQPQTVAIASTPKRQYLTQATKRAILSTGFLMRYGEELAKDTDVINSVIRDIRHEVLRLREGLVR